jgi:hypothetical protein
VRDLRCRSHETGLEIRTDGPLQELRSVGIALVSIAEFPSNTHQPTAKNTPEGELT